jgi:hypothetical protein
MSTRHSAPVLTTLIFVFVAVIRFPVNFTTKATTGHGDMSATTAKASDDSSDRRVVGIFRQDYVKPIATSTPDTEINPPYEAVREGQAVTTELGPNVSASTYWVSASDGWHVVTTVDIGVDQDTDPEKHSVVRFSAVLLPGQSQRISVPAPMGERQQVLRIRRLGDRLEVTRVFGSSV